MSSLYSFAVTYFLMILHHLRDDHLKCAVQTPAKVMAVSFFNITHKFYNKAMKFFLFSKREVKNAYISLFNKYLIWPLSISMHMLQSDFIAIIANNLAINNYAIFKIISFLPE